MRMISVRSFGVLTGGILLVIGLGFVMLSGYFIAPEMESPELPLIARADRKIIAPSVPPSRTPARVS